MNGAGPGNGLGTCSDWCLLADLQQITNSAFVTRATSSTRRTARLHHVGDAPAVVRVFLVEIVSIPEGWPTADLDQHDGETACCVQMTEQFDIAGREPWFRWTQGSETAVTSDGAAMLT